ncbi:surfeit locus protein 4 homolog [Drosophila eugracilis]|uniref:surfeit locus protein 4 homolog n=1 Tax=Drosophila eugracilis TaxID=29029 RepID=UPI001BD9FDAB|nr:surfeit locus protein 4 homolog [Drosophila eugracilis]
MGIDPFFMEKYQIQVLKWLLSSLARIFVVSNFIADALYTYRHWNLQRSTLNMTWRCGYLVAEIYICLLTIAQLIASLLIVIQRQKHVATGILWIVVHLRIAANSELWNLAGYLELCCVISALLLIMLDCRRNAVVSFLMITYLDCKDLDRLLWHILYKYVLKLAITFLLVSCQKKLSAGLLMFLLIFHCLDTQIWGDASTEDMLGASWNLQRIHFWHKVSVTGGLILIAATNGNHQRML